ncbi:MAG: flagellar basal body-associated FliL family protein [Methylococcales bacterium]|nr:flagellar basal body-associated FliL family protein [Methylococcales bacterium]MDD5754824.1 flagellar basal body-associated FliL family protein [Methylococcales bacterium]
MAQAKQEGEVKKSSKKPLIILVLAIIFSLAVGAGGMFFYMKQIIMPREIEAVCAEPPLPVVTTIYTELSKPLIVNFPQGSSIRLVKMTLAMAAENEATIAILKKNEPMLLNNLLMLISAQNTDSLKTHDGKVALRNAIFDDVTATLEKTSPGAEIKEVFFTSFIMQ